MPPAFRHHRGSTAASNVPYAVCKGRGAVCDYSISRREGNLSAVKNKRWEISPGVSAIKCHLLFSNVLQSFPGKLHIGVDGWTSPNVFSFLGLLVHGENEGKLYSMILDFIRCVSFSHPCSNKLTNYV